MTGAIELASTAELTRVTGEEPAPGGLPEHPVGGRVIRIPAGQCVRRRAGPGVVGGHRERGRRSPGGELALRAGDLAQVEARPAQGHWHRQLEVSAVPEHGHVAG